MNIRILPASLQGITKAPSSKSYAHRALICAALADAPTRIVCPDPSEDILITAQCMRQLGAQIKREGEDFLVTPIGQRKATAELFCGQSGSTLRFLMPVAAALGTVTGFDGEGRLPSRPIGQLCRLLAAHGASCSAEKLPLTVAGKLLAGRYAIDGSVSSQFISGLMLASPLTGEECCVSMGEHPASLPYLRITQEMMKIFGVDALITQNTIEIKKGSYRTPGTVITEGDWSGAAFFLCAGALSEEGISVMRLDPRSTQGDKEIVELIRRFGASVSVTDDSVTVKKGQCLPFDADAEDIPDLIPIAAVLACFASGESHFYHAGRLRIKESDRMAATVNLIDRLGGKACADGDTLTVYGKGKLFGGRVQTYADHRMVMAASIAAAFAEEEVIVEQGEAVGKSFPDFFEKFRSLGGNAREV